MTKFITVFWKLQIWSSRDYQIHTKLVCCQIYSVKKSLKRAWLMFHYILIFPYVSFLAVNPKNWRKTFNKAQKFSEKINLHNLRHALVLRKYSPIWIFWRKWTFRLKQKLFQENLTIGILSFCKISIFILSWHRKTY